MQDETRHTTCAAFYPASTLSEDLLRVFERMHDHTYAPLAASLKKEVWPPGKFRQKLASYGQVALLLDRVTQTPRCFLVYSSSTCMGQFEALKAGPLGFAVDVRANRQKVIFLNGLLAAFGEQFPRAILWAEVPTQATALEKLLTRQGYTACDSLALIEMLLASAEVRPISLVRRQGAICYETATKDYPQKILLRLPSTLAFSAESASVGGLCLPRNGGEK